MSKIGIGADQPNSKTQPSSGWQLGYAWAVTLAPSVSTTQRQDVALSSVVANVQPIALPPSISTSSAVNQNIQPSVSGGQASALAPSVQTAGTVNVAPPVGQANATTGNHVVSAGSVINVSISSIVAGVTASAGIPTVSVGSGGTSYYLQMDGVDDYIKTPSITFNEVIIDAVFRQKTGAWQNYLDARTGYSAYLLRDTTNKDSFSGMTVYVDGVQKTVNTTFVPSNQRTTLRMVLTATATDDVNIFSKNTNVEVMTGDIYSVKFLNAGATVAFYDMTTGTVQDQSGNGKNATLNGGTWMVA